MKPLLPLNPEARNLVDLSRTVDRPDASERRRMRRRLGDALSVPPPAVPANRWVPEGSLGRLRGPSQGWALGAATAAIGGAFLLGRLSSGPSNDGAPIPAGASVAAMVEAGTLEASNDHALPGSVEAEVLQAQLAEETEVGAEGPAPEPARPRRRESNVGDGTPSARARLHSPTRLLSELDRLARVESALRAGEPKRALAQLAAFQPRTRIHEARALRAVALCQSGDTRRGRSEMESVLERWPDSVFSLRLDKACSARSRR